MAMILCRATKSKKRPPMDRMNGNTAITSAVEFTMDPESCGMRCAAVCTVGSSIFNWGPGLYKAGDGGGRLANY